MWSEQWPVWEGLGYLILSRKAGGAEWGGLTGAQAEQDASLSPHPEEIPERGQLAELGFPVVS